MRINAEYYETHPIGSFRARIDRIEQDTSKYDGKPQLVFFVTTTPTTGEPIERTMRYWTSVKLSPQSNLGALFTSVCGKPIEAGLTIDTDRDLLHQEGVVFIEQYTKDNGQKGSRIKDWLPASAI